MARLISAMFGLSWTKVSVLGSQVSGQVSIENCALPWEGSKWSLDTDTSYPPVTWTFIVGLLPCCK